MTLAAPMSRNRTPGTKFHSRSEREWSQPPALHSLRSVQNSTTRTIALGISPSPALRSGVAEAGITQDKFLKHFLWNTKSKSCHLQGHLPVYVFKALDCTGKDLDSHEQC